MDLFVVGRNQRVVSGQGSWGGWQYDPLHPDRRPPAMDPGAELKTFQASFDKQLELGHSHVCILGHPTCWAMSEWWGWYDWTPAFHVAKDGVPGAYPHGRRWERGVPRSKADSEAHLKWTEQAARWLAKRTDIRLMTFAQFHREHAEPAGQWLTQAQVRAVARSLCKRLDPVEVGGVSLSAAEALFVLAQYGEFLLREQRLPGHLQVRRTLGPVESVLIPERELTFKRQAYLLAARQVHEYVLTHGRLPSALRAHYVECGPGEVLVALARAFSGRELPEEVAVQPTRGVPDCADIPFFANATAASQSARPGYRPERIHEQGLLQSWSYRPARSALA
jgi:hypothetical protein